MQHDERLFEHELPAIKHELAFADIHSLQELRHAQDNSLRRAGEDAVFDLSIIDSALRAAEVRSAARQQAASHFSEYNEEAVTRHINTEKDPELTTRLVAFLDKYSLNHMDDERWYQGDKNDNGQYQYETSGKYQAEQEFDALCQELLANRQSMPEPEAAEEQAEYEGENGDGATLLNQQQDGEAIQTVRTEHENKLETLAETRKQLAELSIERRRLWRKGGKKAKRLAEEYEAKENEYYEALIAAGASAIKIMRLRGADDDRLKVRAIELTTEERHNFSKAEREYLDNDPSTFAKVARWLSKRKRNFILGSIIGGGTLGFATGWGVKQVTRSTAAIIGAGTALPLAIGLGLGSRAAKVALTAKIGNRTHQYTTHQKIADQDQEEFNGITTGDLGSDENDIDSLAERGSNLITHHVHERIEKDRKQNARRLRNVALLSGAAGLVGAVIADTVAPVFTGGNNHHAAVTPPTQHHTPHGGGHYHNPNGGQTPPPNSNEVAGFDKDIDVPYGAGYTNELASTLHERGISLTGTQYMHLYNDVIEDTFHGRAFTDIGSYWYSPTDNYRISSPGATQWRPEVLQAIHEWLINHNSSDNLGLTNKQLGI